MLTIKLNRLFWVNTKLSGIPKKMYIKDNLFYITWKWTAIRPFQVIVNIKGKKSIVFFLRSKIRDIYII